MKHFVLVWSHFLRLYIIAYQWFEMLLLFSLVTYSHDRLSPFLSYLKVVPQPCVKPGGHNYAPRVQEKASYLWPAERKPGTSRKYWIWVRGNFIRTGRFPAKLRLLHQRVTGGLHCMMLNYKGRLCYYNNDISSNSQAGPWNTGRRCYGQLVRVFQKTRFYQLPVRTRLSFCP